MRGKCKWFASKGHGFITGEDNQDYFVHYTAISGNGFKTLDEGEAVEFDATKSDKGLRAENVRRLAPATPANP
jgi:CspA family cold shock protein